MNIRLEKPTDYREVENLTREAFWNVYRPGCTEHFVLNRTNADGSTNFDYCQYCFKDGAFTTECGMEEMADHCSQFVDKYNEETGNNLTREAYKDILLGFYPILKRWRMTKH